MPRPDRKRVVPYADGKSVADMIASFTEDGEEESAGPLDSFFSGPIPSVEVSTETPAPVSSREQFKDVAERMSWQLGVDLARVIPAMMTKAQMGDTKAAGLVLQVFRAMREVTDRVAERDAQASIPTVPVRGIMLPGDSGVARFDTPE